MDRIVWTIGLCVGLVVFAGYLLGLVDMQGIHWEENQIVALQRLIESRYSQN